MGSAGSTPKRHTKWLCVCIARHERSTQQPIGRASFSRRSSPSWLVLGRDGEVSGFAHPDLANGLCGFLSSCFVDDSPRRTAWLVVLCSLGFLEVVYAQGSVALSFLVRAR